MARTSIRKYLLALAAFVVALDRLTKWLIVENLPLYDSIRVIPGLFSITHVQNPGAAFGLFADSESEWKLVLLILFSIAALAVVTALLWRDAHGMLTTGIGLALILGGAVGNLWDRVQHGKVTDFLLFYFNEWHWPAFNVADTAIVLGALMLMAEILFGQHEERTQDEQKSA